MFDQSLLPPVFLIRLQIEVEFYFFNQNLEMNKCINKTLLLTVSSLSSTNCKKKTIIYI